MVSCSCLENSYSVPYQKDCSIVVENVYDDKMIKKIVEMCYFEGKYNAGFNTYPLTGTSNLNLIYYNLVLCNMGYYALSEEEIKIIVQLLDESIKSSFNDEYLYYMSQALLGKLPKENLVSFLDEHYSNELQMYFAESENDTLIECLVATLNCIMLCNQNNIDIPHIDEVKDSLLYYVQENKYYLQVTDIQSCYEAIFNEGGTILRILSCLSIDNEELIKNVNMRKDWFSNILNIVESTPPSYNTIFELWIRNDITEINSFFDLDISGFKEYLTELYKQIDFYNVGFSEEVFCHDSQYIYEMTKLSQFYNYENGLKNFLKIYILKNISTYFRTNVQINLVPRDTYNGLILANYYNIPINRKKIENSANRWLNDFLSDYESTISSNWNGYYAVAILKTLNVDLEYQVQKSIQESVLQKLNNEKYNDIDVERKYIALHEIKILLDIQEVMGNGLSNICIPQWITDIGEDDLLITNFNVAEDWLTINNYITDKNSKYMDKIKINVISEFEEYSVSSSSRENEAFIQKFYQLKNICEIIGEKETFSKKLSLRDLERISISDLSTILYIIRLR